jgi:hypothetical protein
MLASLQSTRWDWNAISALATIFLALSTFVMAWMTRKLAKGGVDEARNTNRLAEAAEEQRDIAARNEYSGRQPIFIPIIPRGTSPTDKIVFQLESGLHSEDINASFVDLPNSNKVSVRMVLINVGRGAGRILQHPSPISVKVSVGAGLEVKGEPDPIVIAPQDTVEILARGTPQMSTTLIARESVNGREAFAYLDFQYSDLNNEMITDCKVIFEKKENNRLRAIRVENSLPRRFNAEDATS